MSVKQSQDPEAMVKEIRRQTRREFTAAEKIRIAGGPPFMVGKSSITVSNPIMNDGAPGFF